MKVHSDTKIERIKDLRSQGHSINEIVRILMVPKTTVWHHVKSVSVLPEYSNQLKSKRGGSKIRSEKAWKEANEKANELLVGEHREISMCASMLYWAEGSKKACEFINSDGRMIKVYLQFIRQVLKLPEAQIKPTMRIFTGMDSNACLDYWSEITEIPKESFIIRYNDGGIHGKTKFGMCRITIKKGANTLKLIHSLILAIINNFGKISFNAPKVSALVKVSGKNELAMFP